MFLFNTLRTLIASAVRLGKIGAVQVSFPLFSSKLTLFCTDKLLLLFFFNSFNKFDFLFAYYTYACYLKCTGINGVLWIFICWKKSDIICPLKINKPHDCGSFFLHQNLKIN